MKNNRFVAAVLIPGFVFMLIFAVFPVAYGLGTVSYTHLAYQEYVKKHQFERLGLSHTSFTGDLKQFKQEDLSLSEYVHQIFKKDERYIDPAETAASYRDDGSKYPVIPSSALRDLAMCGHLRRIFPFGISGLPGAC